MSSFQFEQIGVIRSPYKEKFAVPRSLVWSKAPAANCI